MPTPQPAKQLHALCHEHHIEMRLTEVLIKTEGAPTHTSTYACPEPDCAVSYTPSKGYFLAAKHGQVEHDMTPRVTCRRDGQRMYLAEINPEKRAFRLTVTCRRDGQRMYLAEINPEKRAFRLWRCPLCDSIRTNEEGLVNELPTPLLLRP